LGKNNDATSILKKIEDGVKKVENLYKEELTWKRK
jgi:hypothetical protein